MIVIQINKKTSRDVLDVCKDAGLLKRDSAQSHRYYPSLGFVMAFRDDLRRLFRDVMADDTGDSR